MTLSAPSSPPIDSPPIDSPPTYFPSAQAGGLVRPLWSRWRFWAGVAAAVVVAAAIVGLIGGAAPARTLSLTSTQPDGSRAFADVLRDYGTRLVATSELSGRGAVVVTDPDAFSAAQLRALVRTAGRVVLVQPGLASTRAVLPAVQPGTTYGDSSPSCDYPGARAAGTLALPADTIGYARTGGDTSTATRCYGGALVVSPTVVIVGSAQLFENSELGNRGVAALAVNVVSGDRTLRSVRWLMPGASAAGAGQVTIWTLFPPGVRRVALWLVLVGLLAVLWRARRLGPAVREPLPVVVRSAEIVEGHGRLYERAGARDRAAAVLRTAAGGRIARRLALPQRSDPSQLVAAAGARLDRPAGEVWTVLSGPPPADDAQLVGLARELDQVEQRVASGGAEGGVTDAVTREDVR